MTEGIVEHIVGPGGEIVEVVVKAPIAEMRLAAAEAKQAPPSEREVAEIAMAVAQEEYDEAKMQKLAAGTITTVTLAIAYAVLHDEKLMGRVGSDGQEIRIPRWIIDRVTGGKLGISETADRDVILRWRERAEAPVQPEEMR